MSLSVWQENRAVDLRAKGYPPREVARIVEAPEEEVRRFWPRLTFKSIDAPKPVTVGMALAALPKPPSPPPGLKEPVWLNGVKIQPRQVLPKFPPRAREILKQVAVKHDMRLDVLFAERRYRVLVVARQEAMYRIWKELDYSFPHIGRLFGVDHTTVIHATGRHADRIKAGKA